MVVAGAAPSARGARRLVHSESMHSIEARCDFFLGGGRRFCFSGIGLSDLASGLAHCGLACPHNRGAERQQDQQGARVVEQPFRRMRQCRI